MEGGGGEGKGGEMEEIKQRDEREEGGRERGKGGEMEEIKHTLRRDERE